MHEMVLLFAVLPNLCQHKHIIAVRDMNNLTATPKVRNAFVGHTKMYNYSAEKVN